MILIIKTDGTHIEARGPVTLRGLQSFVGGYIEQATLDGHPYDYCFFNEEGLLLNLEPNLAASKRLGFSIVGDVVFCTQDEVVTTVEQYVDRATNGTVPV